MKRGVLSTTLTLILWVSSHIGAASSSLAEPPLLPPPPQYYVLDEPMILSKPILRALEALLVEHDYLTGEQVFIGIFKSLDGADLVTRSQQVFTKWQIGNRGKDNGALLTLFWKEQESRLVIGYGLEPILTDLKSEEILTDFLKPALQNGHPDRAVGLAALQLLKTLDSPLVHNGKAQEILQAADLPAHGDPAKSIPLGWTFWLILGFILLLTVLHLLTSADAHFSKHGWSKPRPWSHHRRSSWLKIGNSSDNFIRKRVDSQSGKPGSNPTKTGGDSYSDSDTGGATCDW